MDNSRFDLELLCNIMDVMDVLLQIRISSIATKNSEINRPNCKIEKKGKKVSGLLSVNVRPLIFFCIGIYMLLSYKHRCKVFMFLMKQVLFSCFICPPLYKCLQLCNAECQSSVLMRLQRQCCWGPKLTRQSYKEASEINTAIIYPDSPSSMCLSATLTLIRGLFSPLIITHRCLHCCLDFLLCFSCFYVHFAHLSSITWCSRKTTRGPSHDPKVCWWGWVLIFGD